MSSVEAWTRKSEHLLSLVIFACALVLRCDVAPASTSADPPTAAIFLNDWPGSKPGLARELASELTASGYAIQFVGPDVLTNTTKLFSQHIRLLVLPHARSLPVASMIPVSDFLHAGGNLIALGLPAWQSPTFVYEGEIHSTDEYHRLMESQVADHTIIDFAKGNLADWTGGIEGAGTKTAAHVEDAGAEGKVLHVVIDHLGGWDVLESPPVSDPFPGRRSLTCFRARGAQDTHEMSVEWDEQDGSRWIAVVDLTPQWKPYSLPPEAFRFWASTPGRGGRGDHLDVRHAHRLSVGLARSHSAFVGDHHEYWIGNIGSARAPFNGLVSEATMEAPRLDSLSPSWKFYSIHGPVNLTMPEGLAFASGTHLRALRGGGDPLLAMQPRPRVIGFKQERPWRWQPLLEARSPQGEERGAVASLLIHGNDDFPGGLWADFTPDDPGFYRQPQIRQVLRQTALAMRRGSFLLEGGSEFFTVFEEQKFELGARAANFGLTEQSNLTVRIGVRPKTGGGEMFAREWPLALAAGSQEAVQASWQPDHWPVGGLMVTVELLQGGQVVDRLEHELNVWRPRPRLEYIEERGGAFELGGRPWKINGVNYMPSTGMGISSGDYFNNWLCKGAYDPEAIERDLERIKAMNVNAVSVFINYRGLPAQHLLDFLRRCDALGLHVNQALQVGTPMNFQWKQIKELIERYRLAENDTVFAYDLAWEPEHHDQQNSYGRDWTSWVLRRYGTLAQAQTAWGVDLPALDNAGTLSVPPMRDLANDGPWRVLVADYRAFLDSVLAQKYGEARRLVRSIDPHHAVSFRMAEAGDPTLNSEGELPYDFYGLAKAVDIWEPEGYGRIGDWKRVRDGRFEVAYARLCDSNKPVLWAETGYSAWDQEHGEASPQKLEFEAAFFRDFYRMMGEAGCDGVFFWYYPGGYRTDERSDFGIINPDGTDRPMTRIIREEGLRFLQSTKPPRPNDFILVNRDRDARGLFGIYQAVKDEYWHAIAEGKTPGLKWAVEPGRR